MHSTVDNQQSTVNIQSSTVNSPHKRQHHGTITDNVLPSYFSQNKLHVQNMHLTVDSRHSIVNSQYSPVASQQSTVNTQPSTLNRQQSSQATARQHHNRQCFALLFFLLFPKTKFISTICIRQLTVNSQSSTANRQQSIVNTQQSSQATAPWHHNRQCSALLFFPHPFSKTKFMSNNMYSTVDNQQSTVNGQ
jgi:hypothetical protein